MKGRLTFCFLFIVLVAATGRADTRSAQFSATTLSGESLSSGSLAGNVVLLQFWASWCPYCRRDEAALDRLQSSFSDQGLTVIAIDAGDTEQEAKAYLQAHPRSCRVVLKEARQLASQFGVHSLPHYVVIDRNGSVVASQAGSGGEAYLRQLVALGGIPSQPKTQMAARQPATAQPTASSGPRWTNVEVASSPFTAKPLPKTVFIFSDGSRVETQDYVMHPGSVRMTVDGVERVVPFSSLDMKKTVALNHERGIQINVPTNNNEVFLSF